MTVASQPTCSVLMQLAPSAWQVVTVDRGLELHVSN